MQISLGLSQGLQTENQTSELVQQGCECLENVSTEIRIGAGRFGRRRMLLRCKRRGARAPGNKEEDNDEHVAE
ncbi:MAG: hypothetical protein HY852_12195 [Bradyrhizobium sp.]|uniref:hypothetical protein n=1 Tax=Bradyrhizobium sp. TaxID=376 RepID=UPI0025C03AFD|nr:hypothetical protein [Bradyrhizobium sp.]MBI5262564.1 hypothetical protein [Bradyrhizobium sp.]